MIDIIRNKAGWYVTATNYQLEIRERGLRARLTAQGTEWSDISLLSSVNGGNSPTLTDETYGTPSIICCESSDTLEIRVTTPSTAWRSRTTVLRASEKGVDLHVEVKGDGPIYDVILGGGLAMFPNGACGLFRSRIGFRSVFVPTPTEPVAALRSAHANAVLSVVGDAEPGRLHAVFSPPPLCFAFGSRQPSTGAHVPVDGTWCGLLVLGAIEDLSMTAVAYEPLDGGWVIRMPFEGHTSVRGRWSSPTLRFVPVDSPWQAVTALTTAVTVDATYDACAQPEINRQSRTIPEWWLRPLFCGWGAQCAEYTAIGHGDENADISGFVGGATVSGAPDLSRQTLYDHWLDVLTQHNLHPGTIVIDDRWQSSYGTCDVDTDKWPDLASWIAQQHQHNRRVLLWFKAWDPEGLPLDECVTTPDGMPLAADAGSDKYLAHLERIVEQMLSSTGLNADGLKVDFTQRSPSGASLRHHREGVWGIAAVHKLVATLHAAAHRVKPDALIINHTIDPRFADVTDMIRLNDILERDINADTVPAVEQLRLRASTVNATGLKLPIDTDQWPISTREQWLEYVREQSQYGVPSLYYVESVDGVNRFTDTDYQIIAQSWNQER